MNITTILLNQTMRVKAEADVMQLSLSCRNSFLSTIHGAGKEFPFFNFPREILFISGEIEHE